MTTDKPTYELVATDELARLRRIEEAAKEVLNAPVGRRRSATPLLSAMAALRAALKEPPSG